MKRILDLLEVWGKAGNISTPIRRQASKVRPAVFAEQTVWSTQHVVLRLVSKGLCDTCALGCHLGCTRSC